MTRFEPEDVVALVVLALCGLLLALGRDGAIKGAFLAVVGYLVNSLRDRGKLLTTRFKKKR